MTALDGMSFRVLANSKDLRQLFTLGGYNTPESSNTIREKVLRWVKMFHLFHQSPIKRDCLDKHTLSDHGKMLGPIGDCKARWSSTFIMVERFLKIRVSLVKALADVGSNIHFDEVEVKSLALISDGLKEVHEPLAALCDRSTTLLTMDAALTCLLNSIVRTTPFGCNF